MRMLSNAWWDARVWLRRRVEPLFGREVVSYRDQSTRFVMSYPEDDGEARRYALAYLDRLHRTAVRG